MKSMLQSGTALAIALGLSSGALANPQESFSNSIKLTVGQLETVAGGSDLDSGLLGAGIIIAGGIEEFIFNDDLIPFDDALLGQSPSGGSNIAVNTAVNLGSSLGGQDHSSGSTNVPILIVFGGGQDDLNLD